MGQRTAEKEVQRSDFGFEQTNCLIELRRRVGSSDAEQCFRKAALTRPTSVSLASGRRGRRKDEQDGRFEFIRRSSWMILRVPDGRLNPHTDKDRQTRDREGGTDEDGEVVRFVALRNKASQPR